MFLARRGCRGCLYVLVLQVGFLLFCTLFLHCQHLPVLLPATFCLPSVASHCCLFIALARLKFYASTGCVRIGFGSILSCLFVWLCVYMWCVGMWCGVCLVCACVCVQLLHPVGCLQCVLIDVACSFDCFLPPPEAAASCTALPRPFSFSFVAYNQFKCAAVHCKKFLLLLSAKSQCEAIKSGIVGHRMRQHYVWLLMLVCYRGVEAG